MPAQNIREAVVEFKEKYAFGEDPEDCFAPWYLKTVHGVAATEAIRLSAESKQGNNGPGFDFGVDAFLMKLEPDDSCGLTLVQAKYSNSIPYIAKGVRDFTKSIEWLKRSLYQPESDYPQENKVLVNLRSELAKLSAEQKKKITFDFVVIHLSEEDDAILNNRTKEAREGLEDKVRNLLPENSFKIRLEGPFAIEKVPSPVNAPIPAYTITFDGIVAADSTQEHAKMYLGLGRLSELVEIYRSRKDDLFAKNVRLFLNTKKNTEKGPSAKMRESLRAICIDADVHNPPEEFALYHNGITIYARNVSAQGKTLVLREPYILNGCQTIKTAYLFRYASQTSARVKNDIWEKVNIPIRVVDSADEDLIRRITVCTNRQNAITAAAFRANDTDQIALEHRFAERGIFYERQEGAYDYAEDTNSAKLEKDYPNSEWGAVYIEDMAFCLAAAAGNMSLALHVNDIFEGDKPYRDCFSQKRMSSIVFLTFMQNVKDVLTLVLKNDLGLDWKKSYVKSARITPHVFCLLMRYLAKKGLSDPVVEFGQRLWAKNGDWRTEVAKHLDNYHSGLKDAIKDKFMAIDEPNTENITAAFHRIESSLRLTDQVDVFSYFGSIDAIVDSKQE